MRLKFWDPLGIFPSEIRKNLGFVALGMLEKSMESFHICRRNRSLASELYALCLMRFFFHIFSGSFKHISWHGHVLTLVNMVKINPLLEVIFGWNMTFKHSYYIHVYYWSKFPWLLLNVQQQFCALHCTLIQVI